jgi:hypothetical protein
VVENWATRMLFDRAQYRLLQGHRQYTALMMMMMMMMIVESRNTMSCACTHRVSCSSWPTVTTVRSPLFINAFSPFSSHPVQNFSQLSQFRVLTAHYYFLIGHILVTYSHFRFKNVSLDLCHSTLRPSRHPPHTTV